MSPLRRGVLVLLALLGLLVVAAFVTDYGWARGRVERMVTDKTGRQFKLDDLHVRLGFPIRVRLRGVRFANPEWASEPEMLRVEQAEFSVRMAPLLRGRLVLPEVKLAKPVVDLEESADGAQNNWTFTPSTPPSEKKPGSALPEIGSIAVDQGLLLFSRPKEGSAVRVLVETAADALDGKPGLRIQAGGTYRKLALEAEAVGAPVLALLDTRTPYPLRAKVRFGGTQASLTGTVTGLASLSAADLQLEAAGESFSDVYPVLGLSLPPTPPYRIKARILRDGAWWRVHDLVGSMGDSDLAGRVDVTYAKQRPYMQADLTSKVLDLDDLAGLVGVPPSTGAGETASAEQKQEAARRAASPKLLPDVPFKLERLRAMDADVKFTAESLRNKKNAIDHLSVHAILADGVLRTEPLNFGIGGGGVESRLRVDAREAKAVVDADFLVKRVDVRQLFKGSALVQKSAGLIGGRAQLKGTGNSVADLLATADGTFGIAMSGGRVDTLLNELAELDMVETLRALFQRGKTVELRCAVADLAVRDGVLHSRNTVVDTTETNIKIDGDVNLRDESLDLTLHPLPKNFTPMSLRSPLHLKGSLKHPSVRPDEKLIARGAIAAALGALAAPVAALVPLIDNGPGDNAHCDELIAAMQQHAGAAAPPETPAADKKTPAADTK